MQQIAHRSTFLQPLSPRGKACGILAAGVPVGPHLADQLLIPMAMAAWKGGGPSTVLGASPSTALGTSRIRTVAPTRHTTTSIEVIRRFMEVNFAVTRDEQNRNAWEMEVTGE